MRSAQDLYEQMVTIIDQATEAEDLYELPRAAEREGMSGGELRADLSQRWEYTYDDQQSGTVKVECYWYDRSKPFSIQPDRHVMSVSMESAGVKRSHSRHYDK
jgi:hypothetical protein